MDNVNAESAACLSVLSMSSFQSSPPACKVRYVMLYTVTVFHLYDERRG